MISSRALRMRVLLLSMGPTPAAMTMCHAAQACTLKHTRAQEASLAELEDEAGALRDSVTAAESRAAMLEGTLQAAKDQLLRLTADFDNFRRRSVGWARWRRPLQPCLGARCLVMGGGLPAWSSSLQAACSQLVKGSTGATEERH